MKICIIGSGSTYTPELIEGLINRKDEFPVREIALMDIDARKRDIVGALAERMLRHAGMDTVKVVFTADYKEALEGADFVFAQIRVGGLPARILDEKIPLKHGLLGQETTGIGGFFKALRTIPVLMKICEHMKELCPNAWMINFSNPSGICAEALLKHTDVKMLGLCNAPLGMMRNPIKALGMSVADVDYVGLNHLSFITSIRHNKRDYLQEAINGNAALLAKLDGQMNFDKNVIKTVGGIPSYYLQNFLFLESTLQKQKTAEKTRGEICVGIEEELLSLYTDENLKVKPEQLSQRGGAMYSEAAVSLAESIYTDNDGIHVINTFNNGAIPYLEDDDVVETCAAVGAQGAKTVPVTEPGGEYIQNIIRTVKAYERLTVKAAIEGSREVALRALLINPLTGDYETASACFNEMLVAHKDYLPQFV